MFLKPEDFALPKWLPKTTAAEVIGVSTDTIDRRSIPWQDEPEPFKIRYKLLRLGPANQPFRRFCEADVIALLVNPKPRRFTKGMRTPK
jgi:hypothetical protein